jgi:O-antigen/teichoic acid export membrane protein
MIAAAPARPAEQPGQSASIRTMSPQAEPAAEPDLAQSRRRFGRDVILTLGNKLAVLALNVAGTIVVARTLGPAGRGSIAVAFSFTLLLVQFGSFGLQSANPYFAAREPARIPKIFANTLWLALGLGLLLAGVGVFIQAFFPALLRGLDWLEVAVVLLGVPAALANQLLQSILLAEGRMVAYNGIEFSMAVATFVGLVVGLAVFSFGVLYAIVLMVAVTCAGTLAFAVVLRHHKPPLRSPDISLMRAMLRYGTRIYLATLLAYLVGRVNLLLVNSYLGNVAAGEYSISLSIADGIHLLPTVVALNLFPRVARGEPAGDTAAAFRSLALVYGLLCLLTVPLAGPAIHLLYGSAFAESVTIYYWMVPAIFSYGMISVLAYHFAGRGFPREALLIWIPGLVLNFAIVFPLLENQADVTVAALGASLAYTLILVLHMRMFARETGSYRVLVPRPREALSFVVQITRGLKSTAAA